MNHSNAGKIGKYAAVFSVVFAITYSVFQLLAAFKVIPHPHELIWLFLPSLLLAFSFLISVICLHYFAEEDCKVYTAIATAFALLYCAFVSIVYFTQLAVVIPLLLQQKINETHLLAFSAKSFLVAVDCIGYAAMNAATLFAAFAFRSKLYTKSLYTSLLLNGFLTPIVILAYFIPAFMYLGALWMITLPVAMIQAARLFEAKNHMPIKHTSFKTASI
jgi:hypothetical protein